MGNCKVFSGIIAQTNTTNKYVYGRPSYVKQKDTVNALESALTLLLI